MGLVIRLCLLTLRRRPRLQRPGYYLAHGRFQAKVSGHSPVRRRHQFHSCQERAKVSGAQQLSTRWVHGTKYISDIWSSYNLPPDVFEEGEVRPARTKKPKTTKTSDSGTKKRSFSASDLQVCFLPFLCPIWLGFFQEACSYSDIAQPAVSRADEQADTSFHLLPGIR